MSRSSSRASLTGGAGSSVSVSPASLILEQGTSGTVTVTLTRGGGFADPVTVTVSGLPSGIATSLSESAGGLVESLRSFVEDVREGMAEREREIHAAFAAGELYEDKFAELRDDAQDGSHGRHAQEGQR